MPAMLPRAVALLALVACAAAVPTRQPGDCISASVRSAAGSLFSSQLTSITQPSVVEGVQVNAARLFEVVYYNTYKVVTNIPAGESYILYQCGAFDAAPTPESLGQPAGTKVFEVPLTSASLPDTTAAAFMAALGLDDRVAYVTKLAGDACLQALSTTCNLDTISASSLDITADPSVGAVFEWGPSSDNAKSVSFRATADTSPVARAEWLKYMALFFNKEHEADLLFTHVAMNYAVVESVAAKAASATVAAGAAPKRVAWVAWWPAKPDWGLPNEPTIQITWPSYQREMTTDAGAVIVDGSDITAYLADGSMVDYFQYGTAPSNGAFLLASNTALLRDLLRGVDVVIDTARYNDQDTDVNDGDIMDTEIGLEQFLTRYGLAASDVFDLKFLKNNGLLRNDGLTNPGSWNEWFGLMVVRPDQCLSDLVLALWPTQHATLQSYNPVLSTALQLQLQLSLATPLFLRNVGKGQMATLVSPSACPLNGCALPQSAICPHVFLGCNGQPIYSSVAQRCAPSCSSAELLQATNAPTGASTTASRLPLLALLALPVMAAGMAVMAAL